MLQHAQFDRNKKVNVFAETQQRDGFLVQVAICLRSRWANLPTLLLLSRVSARWFIDFRGFLGCRDHGGHVQFFEKGYP